MKEIFKDIEGYEGIYQVSNLGNVKSLGNDRTRKDKILKPAKDKKGYLVVCLCKQGKLKQYKLHRLVAQAFIPNPDNLEQVNHKNEIKTDNRVENLEFCDALYNINYGTHNQRVAESRSKKVLCVETGLIYVSIMEVHRQLGLSRGNISSACNGKLKTYKGFHWRFVS